MNLKDKDREKNQVNPPLKRLFTVAESGEYLGRSEVAMRHLINKGEIPYIRMGRRISVTLEDLEKFVEEHRVFGD